MGLCKIFYIIGCTAYILFFCLGGTKLLSDDIFAYNRVFFIVATLIHLMSYDLVPSTLTCPPFYTIYKVLAAIVLTNVFLFTIWTNVELFVSWIVKNALENVDILPENIKEKLPPLDGTVLIITGVYYLFWVLKSTMKTLVVPNARSLSARGRGRRRSSNR